MLHADKRRRVWKMFVVVVGREKREGGSWGIYSERIHEYDLGEYLLRY